MARSRRFRVESLAGLAAGQSLTLPAVDAHHARVLRLKPGSPVDLFDGAGASATGTLAESSPDRVSVLLECITTTTQASDALTLATAWPKGKRAATLVEKCAELGVGRIIPIQFERSVVEKDDASNGVERLRRIASEAAKQSGRADVPRIEAARTMKDLLADPGAAKVLLDPRAETGITAWFQALEPAARKRLMFIVGPEGGFSNAELELVKAANLERARLTAHILRVETAALAACAILSALQFQEQTP